MCFYVCSKYCDCWYKMEQSFGESNIYHVQKLLLTMNRLHMFLHSKALGFLFYYRVCFLFQDTITRESHLSSMALDYPQEKLHVYLSVYGCSPMTLYGLRKAFEFAKWWLPFCRRYRVKNRCPKAYFSGLENDDCDFAKSNVYMSYKKEIKGKYGTFRKEIETFRKASAFSRDTTTIGDHSSIIEVGFLYDSVVENFLTGFILHCNGWTSVFSDPSRPHFLGTATTNLNDVLIQGTRWYSGLFENGIICVPLYMGL
uniref:Cellulose synthase-like protein G1 n=1 Tax=Cicer arietinum TaxID=3827 RepID=A0A1S3DVS0_CICAR|nr:cellulose synthase-like protein G1 [Cicer arietinum]